MSKRREALHRTRVTVAAVALVSFVGHAAGAQSGVLEGGVTADSLGKHLLPGAEIAIPSLSLITRANYAGDYRFGNVAPGRYLVVARLAGYASVGDSVSVSAGGVTEHDFVMASKAVVLDSIVATAPARAAPVISPALRGFEERRASGMGGHFISEDELRRNDNDRLAEIIRIRIPGIVSLSDPNLGGAVYFASSRDQRKNSNGAFLPPPSRQNHPDITKLYACFVSVYIDGVHIYDMSMTDRLVANPPDFNKLDVNQFAGVEFYPGGSSMPMQFSSGSSACGTLLLWTRER